MWATRNVLSVENSVSGYNPFFTDRTYGFYKRDSLSKNIHLSKINTWSFIKILLTENLSAGAARSLLPHKASAKNLFSVLRNYLFLSLRHELNLILRKLIVKKDPPDRIS